MSLPRQGVLHAPAFISGRMKKVQGTPRQDSWTGLLVAAVPGVKGSSSGMLLGPLALVERTWSFLPTLAGRPGVRDWCPLKKGKVRKWVVPKIKWEPGAYHHWYEKLPSQKRSRAWGDLKREYQKVYIEWKTFRAFAQASALDIDPRSIETCDPNAASPPLPE